MKPEFVEYTDPAPDPNEVDPAKYGLVLNAHYKLVRRANGEVSIVNRIHRYPKSGIPIIYKRSAKPK